MDGAKATEVEQLGQAIGALEDQRAELGDAARVNVLLWNRRVNSLKAYVLMAAIVFQIAATVFVALAVYDVLKAAPTAS